MEAGRVKDFRLHYCYRVFSMLFATQHTLENVSRVTHTTFGYYVTAGGVSRGPIASLFSSIRCLLFTRSRERVSVSFRLILWRSKCAKPSNFRSDDETLRNSCAFSARCVAVREAT